MMRSLGICFACILASCSATVPPPVTPEMAGKSTGQAATVAQLERGRVLFASRCIECHTLPPVSRHNDAEWPHLVNAMAGRASLKPAEKEAIIAYILAARGQATDSR